MTVTIKWNELQQQINLRNYYMGESAKSKDIDAVTMQSSTDEEELFRMFADQACNTLTTAVALRTPLINYSNNSNDITFKFQASNERNTVLLPMLKQAILDYLVNEINLQWLLLCQPQMAQTNISLRGSLYQNVLLIFTKLCNAQRIRRRATDLAGI